MTLRPCRECGKEISSEARVCPICGIKKPVAEQTGDHPAPEAEGSRPTVYFRVLPDGSREEMSRDEYCKREALAFLDLVLNHGLSLVAMRDHDQAMKANCPEEQAYWQNADN
jgi:hypothetical protein